MIGEWGVGWGWMVPVPPYSWAELTGSIPSIYIMSAPGLFDQKCDLSSAGLCSGCRA